MRAVIGTTVFVVGAALGLALTEGGGGPGWSRAAVLLAAAVGALFAARHGIRRPGLGEDVCPECHGEGRAFYGRGRTTRRRRCRACRGRGLAARSAAVRIPEALLHPGVRTDGATVPVTGTLPE